MARKEVIKVDKIRKLLSSIHYKNPDCVRNDKIKYHIDVLHTVIILK